ncbi:Uncharacterized conserved protein [uncultured Clostridium sp.]|nr:Uncharacterized conserved protein [uncultured Clostridium sp.]
MINIYTIGHSNYSIERFVEMLRKYKIDVVVDIRGTPYSKYNTQYNKEALGNTLKDLGFKYIYMGNEFAAQRDNKLIYTWEGYSDFEKVIKEPSFINGVERLKKGLAKGYRIVLLGAKQDPVNCHRFALVGRELYKRGFDVKHIEDDLSTSSQLEVEERMLDKYYPKEEQITIDFLLSGEKSRNEKIIDSYRKVNREIGFRVENLNVAKKN